MKKYYELSDGQFSVIDNKKVFFYDEKTFFEKYGEIAFLELKYAVVDNKHPLIFRRKGKEDFYLKFETGRVKKTSLDELIFHYGYFEKLKKSSFKINCLVKYKYQGEEEKIGIFEDIETIENLESISLFAF